MLNRGPDAKRASGRARVGVARRGEWRSRHIPAVVPHPAARPGTAPLCRGGDGHGAGSARPEAPGAARGARGSITPQPKTFLSFFLSLLGRFLKPKFSLGEVFQGRWRESRKPKRIVLLVKAFNNYF